VCLAVSALSVATKCTLLVSKVFDFSITVAVATLHLAYY
jgi:hypothetical protein